MPTHRWAEVLSVWERACRSSAGGSGCGHRAAGWACWALPGESVLVGLSPGWVPTGSHLWWFAGGQAGYLKSIGTYINFLCVDTRTYTMKKALTIFFISLSFSSDIHRVWTSGSSVLLCNNHTTITPHTAIFICLQNVSHCSSKYPWWLTHFMSNVREIFHFSSTKPILPLLCRCSNCPGNYVLI